MTNEEFLEQTKLQKVRSFLSFPADLRKRILYNTQVMSAFNNFNVSVERYNAGHSSSMSLSGYIYPAPANYYLAGVRRISCIEGIKQEDYLPYIELGTDITIDELIKADIQADLDFAINK